MMRLALIFALLLVPLTGLAQTDTPTETPTATPTETPTETPTPNTCSGNPNRFWVGNSGNWSDTDHWSCTSGGAGGASVPDLTLDAILDAQSFTVPGTTVTLDTSPPCSAVACFFTHNFDASTVANNPTLSFVLGGPLTASGNVTFSPDLSIAAPGGEWELYLASDATASLTSAGQVFGAIEGILGIGQNGDDSSFHNGTYNLMDDLSFPAFPPSTMLLARGTLNTNGHHISGGVSVETATGTDPITLNLGASLIRVPRWWLLVGGGGIVHVNAGTSTLIIQGILNGTAIERFEDQYQNHYHIVQFGPPLANPRIDIVIPDAQPFSADEVDFLPGTVTRWQVSTTLPAASGFYPFTQIGGGGTSTYHAVIENFYTIADSAFVPYADVTFSGCCIGVGCPSSTAGSCYVGAGGSVDAFSGAPYDPLTGGGGWLAADAPPTPTSTPTATAATATPTITPAATINIKQQYPRERVEFPLLVGGTPVPDTAAYGIDFGPGVTCSSVPEPVQGRTKPRLRCTVP